MNYKPGRRVLVTGFLVLAVVGFGVHAGLEARASAAVHGTIADGSGKGGPLYARIDIDGRATPVYTNPTTGEYSVDLVQGQTYELAVSAMVAGYTGGSVPSSRASGQHRHRSSWNARCTGTRKA